MSSRVSETALNIIPSGYKLTEVGVIPEDWEVDSIGNLVSITTGSRNTQDRIEEGVYPFFVRSQIVERINTFSFDGEAVLTAGDGVGTGKIFHYINGKFDFHQRVYLMYNFSEIVDGYFFYIYFSNNFYDRIMSMTAKSSVDSVRREMIADMKMLLPTKEEQNAIATALSDVDTLISELEKLIAKKQAIKTATMQQLLTGRTRLPQFVLREDGSKKGTKQSELGEIPEDWEIKKIGDITNCTAGGTPNTSISKYWGGTNPWMSSGELHLKKVFDVTERITDDGLANSSTKYVPINSVLIGLAGQGKTRGTVAITRISLCTNQSIASIFPSKNHSSEYLYYNLDSRYEELRGLSTGDGGRGGLNLTIIRNLSLPLPCIEEQTAIATILSDMDEEIQALEQRLSKTRQIKQGMMQELLTGKTRLVNG
ncbi:TPA: restriction endonuclease subunit S [Proteus mirabilis]|uniref:restriction endonuclease subunit S n=1 Tax=Proteus mirabilis TaxID=584 RepID=UPI0006681522|nr:restriction endonuclease subunit S [Proteus mirabilis]MBI6336790.1 restriction endonuclease subunit S [Proteus mirabilis]